MAYGAGIGREHFHRQLPAADIVKGPEGSFGRAVALQAAPQIGDRRRRIATLTVAAGEAVLLLPAPVVGGDAGRQVGEIMGAVIGRTTGQAIIGEEVKAGILSEDRADAGRNLLGCDGLATARHHQAEIVMMDVAGETGIDDGAVVADQLDKVVSEGLAEERRRARPAGLAGGLRRGIGVIADRDVMDEPDLAAGLPVMLEAHAQPFPAWPCRRQARRRRRHRDIRSTIERH